MRDYADVSQLVCLSNLENINALFIKEGMDKSKRLEKLNSIAIEQMMLLTNRGLRGERKPPASAVGIANPLVSATTSFYGSR